MDSISRTDILLTVCYMSLIPAVLLCGSIITTSWLVLGWLRAGRLCRGAAIAPEFAQQELRKLVGKRSRFPNLLVCKTFSTAGANGLWQPTILLPAQAVQLGACDASLRAILAHEWAHIERGDLWLLALGRLLLVLLYPHPAYWLLRRRISADQELLADAAAAIYCGRHKYAETLVSWARHQPRGSSRLNCGLGIWERPSQISRRIAMLLDERIRLRMACSRGWRIVSACAMLGLVLGLSLFTFSGRSPANEELPANSAKPASEAATASPKIVAPSVSAKPQAADAAEITGKCVDLKHKPVADAHVLVFRIDHSDKTHLVPHGRTKLAKAAVEGSSIKSQLTYNYSSGDPEKQRIVGEARTDATGRFRVPNLKADEAWLSQEDQVYVVIHAPGKGTIETMAILNHVGKRLVSMVNPTMLTAESLRGRITNAEGKPVADAIVYWAEINPLPKPVPGIYCAKTDADGRYDINDLYATDLAEQAPEQVTPFGAMQTESMVLSVEHPDYAPGVIEFTKIPSEHDLVLHRPATLRGQVTDYDGKAAEKAYVSWTHDTGLSDGTWTDADGHYSLSRLVPGKYTITTLRDDRVASSHETKLKTGEQTLDLQLRQGAHLKARIVEDVPGTAQNAVHYSFWGQPFQSIGTPDIAKEAMRSTVHQLHATVDPHDPMKGIMGNPQPDGSFSMTVVPGRNFIYLVNPDLKVVHAEKLAKQGIELVAGQTVDIELRVVPRPGGWSAWMDEVKAADAAEKGLPAPPPTKPAEEFANVGESAEERMLKEYMDWPTDLLPKKPMSEEAVMQSLSGLKADVEYKTIGGEDCVTAIQVAAGGLEFGKWEFKSQIIWLEFSLLAHIDRFPHLESMGLIGANCDRKWMAPLAGHKELQGIIFMWAPNVTPEGIQTLATLPKLETVALVGPTIDDVAVRELNRLPHVKTMQIGGPFTDRGVEYLRGNAKLTTLVLYTIGRGKITDESLRHVGSLPNLEHFALASMAGNVPVLTDQGLKYLASSTNLEDISIHGERITDDGLVHLYGLKKLKELDISQTMVTQKGVDELKKHLPGLKVTSPVKKSVSAEASNPSAVESRR
jgi:protocatechuate 3,4-dioxygenase beta subunit